MLAEERGALVPFRDPAALAEKVIDLLDNEAKRHAMRKRAYLFGREMIWPKVARRYMESFERARAERRHFTPPGFTVKALDKRPGELPPLKLDHLRHYDGRDRHVATRHFHGPQLSGGLLHRRQRPGPDRQHSPRGTGHQARPSNWLPAISLSSGMPSIPRPGDFATSWITSAIGWKKAAPTTAMAGPCGPWAPCWAFDHTRPPEYGRLGVRAGLAGHSQHHQSPGLGLRPHRHP